jgi:Flp pilus assembly protein TadG
VRFLERLNSPVVLVVAVAVFLVLDGFLLYRYQQSLQSTGESASDAPVEEASFSPKGEPTEAKGTTSSSRAAETTATKETTSSSKEEEVGVRVIVEVAGSSGVGLSILEDGLLVYDQVTSSGFSEEFEAEEAITVTAADAGSVRVGVDGDDPEVLGASGEQATRTFTAEA